MEAQEEKQALGTAQNALEVKDADADLEEPNPDTDEDTHMALASGVGQRRTRTAQTFGKLNRFFGIGDPYQTADEDPDAKAARQRRELNRGAVTALVLLLVFLPLVTLLGFLYYDSLIKLNNVQQNAGQSAPVANTSSDTVRLITAINDRRLQILQFKAEDNSPGQFSLLSTGNYRWIITYGKQEPLNNQVYVVWITFKQTPGQAAGDFKMATLPDVRGSTGYYFFQEKDFPASFDVAFFTELFVTVEPANQDIKQPTGPRRYSLDLSQVRG
jgi:hypothetical protein